jgi:hypothetical protein
LSIVGAASKKKNSNEPVLPYKRERNKINSLARALQLEHALYNDETVLRFAAISDQINNIEEKFGGSELLRCGQYFSKYYKETYT